jgi:hypothetical protein
MPLFNESCLDYPRRGQLRPRLKFPVKGQEGRVGPPQSFPQRTEEFLRKPSFLKPDAFGRLSLSKNTCEYGALAGESVKHALFYRAFSREIDDLHGFLLPVPMGASYSLFQDRWIPGQVEIDHQTGRLQVEPQTAS